MLSVLDLCQPRRDLLEGTFNPEIFTAVLSQVIDHYRGKKGVLANLYTDPKLFFGEATHPTADLKSLLGDVFGRLSGDPSRPAIHRLETAFGGGKTHALIACTHVGMKGRELAGIADELVDRAVLPEPGSVHVVGIAGDELPVQKVKGSRLLPYTLWGEIAYQIGGTDLYAEVEGDATSYAAPGKDYFESVLGDRNVLLLLDELAQYAARLEAARADGAQQLAAFLMGLSTYARTHSSVVVILTLAGATDAFSRQTGQLVELLSKIRGEEVSTDQALEIGERALQGVASVVARDASVHVPIRAEEISRVLGKRLFESVDHDGAREVAEAYRNLYQRSSGLLPPEATQADYPDRIVSSYPFHPTLLSYLNGKLATAERFQGTRGVLRLLALTVRQVWAERLAVPAIHACHIDLAEPKVVNELIGRTGTNDLIPIINADVGGADSSQLEGGLSNAQIADRRNPHPGGLPLYEYTWRTVFLHSLVGREKGLSSNLFGIGEAEALLAASTPGMTPPQVQQALREIGESAFYLRGENGRYYADLDPSINRALAQIRRNVSPERIHELLRSTARKIVKGDRTFHVAYDVSLPEHIEDKQGRPTLGVVSLDLDSLKVEDFITLSGENRPRIEQNLVFLLVPEMVAVRNGAPQQTNLVEKTTQGASSLERLQDLARSVLALRQLKEKPQEHGLNPARLDESDFAARFRERDQALVTAVTETYRSLWFPSASGQIVRKEIKTSGGEGGAAIIEQIRRVLLDEGEIVTEAHTGQAELSSLAKLFFERADIADIAKVAEHFRCLRRWPVLEAPNVLERVVRSGVTKGVWCLFRLEDAQSTKPEEFYDRDNDLPYHFDLAARDYSLITPAGAKQRGWGGQAADRAKVRTWVAERFEHESAFTYQGLRNSLQEQHGELAEEEVRYVVTDSLQEERLAAYDGELDQTAKPEPLIYGASAALFVPEPATALITPAELSRRGWLSKPPRRLELKGREQAKRVHGLLRQIGSLYNRGASSTLAAFDLVGLNLPGGGTLRLALQGATPDSLKRLGELLEVLAGQTEAGFGADLYMAIDDPDTECLLVKALTESKP